MKITLVGRFLVYTPEPIGRNRNYISNVDLSKDYRFWEKVYEIESDIAYPDKCRSFLKKILEFLDDWEYISWKQYNLVMRMYRQEQRPWNTSEEEHYTKAVGFVESAMLNSLRRHLDQKHPEEAAEAYLEQCSLYDLNTLSNSENYGF